MNLHQYLRANATARMLMPAQRFFTPTSSFWDYMRGIAGVQIIECGAGSGDLIGEAEPHGIAITAVDLCKREGQDPRVIQKDATMLEWSPTKWPLICRPSHDGWAYDVAVAAQRAGATTLWVGLPRNFARDLADFGPRIKMVREGVGEEGEKLYLIRPKEQRQ